MESSSLLGSYIHVVYENKIWFEKNVFRKIFFGRWKFWNLTISENSENFQKSLSKSDLIYLKEEAPAIRFFYLQKKHKPSSRIMIRFWRGIAQIKVNPSTLEIVD